MRIAKRRIAGLAVAATLVCMAQPVHAQDDVPNAGIEHKLKTQFTLTKVTADRSDIVTPGSILVLHKDGLEMASVDTRVPPTNTFKNGAISFGFGAKMAWSMALGGKKYSDVPQRKFVAGEKFWITSYSVQNDGVLLQLYSDAYGNIRYYGQLKIAYPKGAVPPPDDVMKTISEIVTVDSVPQSAASSAPPPAVDVTMAPVVPPPPPADATPPPPKTIALGQTKDQVVAILGAPQKVASLGPKEICYYPDMKVILVKGKVTDVQ